MAITPKSEDKYVEKCSTAQSFIRTEMSTYRIGTLTPGSNPKDGIWQPVISVFQLNHSYLKDLVRESNIIRS